MIFGIIAFGAGIVVQIGGQDFNRMIYVRCKVSYLWRNVSKPLWNWIKHVDYKLYDAT